MRIQRRSIGPAALAVALTLSAASVRARGDSDQARYTTALRLAVAFYDANRCGRGVAKDNAFKWRADCHRKDGRDVGADLTGGFHDAGDHVKFGLTQAYSAAVLGWASYAFPEAFRKSGSDRKLLLTLRRFTDYFLKSHPRPGIFYYQVGDGGADHTYWGSPEKQPEDRPTRRFADAKNPASDVLGETSAALALGSLAFRGSDRPYADRCLKAAKELFAMGKKTRGVGDGQSFYQSSSYLDDLAWAAIWLHVATRESAYLDEAKGFIQEAAPRDPFHSTSTLSWDDVFPAVMLKMAELTSEQVYQEAVAFNLNHWMSPDMKTTPGGLKYFAEWGVLRYAASASMLALLYARGEGREPYRDFARSQIDYILGKNPSGMSYLIGFGEKYPKEPHHRASVSCRYERGRTDADCVLEGALVGGPDEADEYQDNMDRYQFSEVAIDYNAGLVGALAGLASE